MNYSFFGTCFKDYFFMKSSFKSLVKQNIKPKEIIIIDSGESKEFESWCKNISKKKDIKIIYLAKNLPRVDALNEAIQLLSGDYAIRYDSRSVFPNNYAEKCINELNKGYKIVGGAPRCINKQKDYLSIRCCEIFNSEYVFGYPSFRNKNYNGYSYSHYLGAFDSTLLKKILYRNELKIISEDSQLCKDFTKEGFKPYISSLIKPKYQARTDLKSLLLLFSTYGVSRINTILLTGDLHSNKKILALTIILIIIFISLLISPKLSIFLFLSFLIIYNGFGELSTKERNPQLINIFIASLCQISWAQGLIRGLLIHSKSKSKVTNFIK